MPLMAARDMKEFLSEFFWLLNCGENKCYHLKRRLFKGIKTK